MLKKIMSFGVTERSKSNKSEVIVTQKQNMSYSRDKTGIALHDKKLSRKQWEKGYIDDATYFQTTTTNLKIFDLLFF